MSTDLVNVNVNDDNSLALGIENPYEQDTAVLASVIGTGYLPLLQLCTAAGDAVKTGKVDMNFYAIRYSKENYKPLGKTIDIWLIQWRPRALDTSNTNAIRSSCTPNSPLFQEIKNKADSKVPNNGCQYGPEYLVYVPDIDEYCTFFMGGASSRNEAKTSHRLFVNEQNKFVGGKATLGSKLLKNDKNSWFAPSVSRCQAVLDEPDPNKIRELLINFFNVPDQTGPVEAQAVEGMNVQR